MSNNLILIPGMLCNEALYAPQAEALGSQIDITIADHCGYETMAEIAESVLESAPDSFALAGLSMGGFIAFEIMARAPERVEKLALLNTGARSPLEEQKDQHRLFNALALKDGMKPVLDVVVPVCLDPGRLGDTKLVGDVRQMMEQTSVENFVRQQNAIIDRRDHRDALPGYACPTLIIVGEADAVTPPKLSEEIAELIPHAILNIIPDCGHISTLERPGAVNEAMKMWLEG